MKSRSVARGQFNLAPWALATAVWLAPLQPAPCPAAEPATDPVGTGPADISFRLEVERGMQRGLSWLQANQAPEGHWSTADHTAITALALLAFHSDTREDWTEKAPETLAKGYRFLLGAVRPDGGIHHGQLANYNTALSLLAFLAAGRAEYEPIILKARQYLVGLQVDLGEKGKLDTPYDGGVGYGTDYEHSDMSNTLQALEALYYSRQLARDSNRPGLQELNWQAAIHFIQNCQNLPAYNRAPWVSGDPENKGGFVYYPGSSKAGGETNAATGRVALRSYGSISYAGMLSYIYADLPKDDSRVLAVYDWLRNNYTLAENPGMGPQGLYYYYHTMAKALTAYGVDRLNLTDGRQVDWRRQLAMTLINRQQKDGSWINEQHGRWWEKDPSLVTSYAVLTLGMVSRGL